MSTGEDTRRDSDHAKLDPGFVRELAERYDQAWNAKNVAGFLALHTPRTACGRCRSSTRTASPPPRRDPRRVRACAERETVDRASHYM